jgi:VCBS repeat-containing protein
MDYQWYFNGSPINGATQSGLTVPGTYANAGQYYVTVHNAGGTVYSTTVTLTVLDTAPTAKDDSYSTAEDTKLTVPAPGILNNDSDLNGDSITASLVSTVSHGTLIFHANGNFIYTPATNYFGTDSFVYRAYDGLLYSGNTTVMITVTPVNDPPIAYGQNITIVEDASTNIVFSATDVDSSNLSYSIVAAPTNGTLSPFTNIGGITYTPARHYNGADSFTFRVYDGSLYSTGRVSLTIAPVAAVVTTMSVSNAVSDSAALRGGVNPMGSTTAWYFIWGTSDDYGWATPANQLPAGGNSVIVTTTISGLNPGTTYHYCIVATNSAGMSIGDDKTFIAPLTAPIVATQPASNVTVGGAMLNGSVDSQGVATGWRFEYGLTTNYGSVTPMGTMGISLVSGGVNASIYGLASGTLYHYRVVATNSGGIAYGQDATFTTISLPPFQVVGSQSNGSMQLSVTSAPGASFSVLSSTNCMLPLSQWILIGTMTEPSPGEYTFIDPAPSTSPQRFYSVRSP